MRPETWSGMTGRPGRESPIRLNLMRVCVTERRDPSLPDLRPAGELAPSLALPWIAKLRDGMLAGQILLVLLAHFFFHIELPLGWLAIPLSASAASNVLLHWFMKPFSARPALGMLLAFDTICLTALLALSGGPANPFSVLYLVEITLSAVVLSKSWTWILGAVSVVGFGSLFWAHVRVPVFEGHHDTEGFSAHLVGMWIAFTVGALLITVFIGKVSEALRRQEQEALQYQRRLAHQERIASIATLAAGAAHELSTPLSTIAVASRDLEVGAQNSGGGSIIADDARLIRSEVERCNQILRQMGGRSAEPAGEMPGLIPLKTICAQVKSELSDEKANLLEIKVGEDAAGVLPSSAVHQALLALVKNAFESSQPGRSVTLTALCEPARICFTVQDRGCGMSPETLNRITEPFFTTKSAGRGLGLGTFLVRLFAERSNGSLAFESEVGAGTTAILELPIPHHVGKR
jgi:two-component system, sensor histidine kinase RegB